MSESGTGFGALPPSAAWRHVGLRDGFEVVHFEGTTARGSTSAVEDGAAWAVGYTIERDDDGRTRRALVHGLSSVGEHRVELIHDGVGSWTVNGAPAPHLTGCSDVDLESSALTNAFPVRRLGLRVGDHADAPAAYVRAVDLGVDRLEQTYRRIDERRFAYTAPVFDFSCELHYDASGLVLAYPGLAVRAA